MEGSSKNFKIERIDDSLIPGLQFKTLGLTFAITYTSEIKKYHSILIANFISLDDK